ITPRREYHRKDAGASMGWACRRTFCEKSISKTQRGCCNCQTSKHPDTPHLTDMHNLCIYVHMRTTLNIDETLLKKAAFLTNTSEKTALVRLGLQALIALESSRRLARLGG